MAVDALQMNVAPKVNALPRGGMARGRQAPARDLRSTKNPVIRYNFVLFFWNLDHLLTV